MNSSLKIAGGVTRHAAARIGRSPLQRNEDDAVGQCDRDSSGQLAAVNDGLVKAQRELVKRNLELEALHREVARWVGIAAHDLRHPLSAIFVTCELLAEEAGDFGPEQRAMLASIHSSCDCMLQLLNDLLDVSAMESGIPLFSPEPIEMRSLIEEAIALCRPTAEHKGIRVEPLYEEPIPVLALDHHKMRQVFLNLIGNAVKYSHAGAYVQVHARVQGGNVLISVRDNGPGIPTDELNSIFKPFHKTRARAATAEPSTGLGLAICKGIIEGHDGKIWAESTLGQGASFHISLPLDVSFNSTPVSKRQSKAAVEIY